MDKESLLQRKADIEARYSQLETNQQEITDELRRLQGEHRLLTELLETADKPKRIKEVKEPENATTE